MASENKITDHFKSPVMVVMLILGIALVVAVPYFAYQTLPGIANPVTGEVAAPKGQPNAGINFQELATLPDDVASAASVILAQEEPMMPELLLDLPEPSGFGLTYPVTEAVETVQPALTWTRFGPGPYLVTVKDRAGMVVASSKNVPNLAFLLPVKLQRGAVYVWEVTAADREFQEAAFIVLPQDDAEQYQRLRREFAQSHLALGLIAEHFGQLSAAEREYQELAREFPNAEAPARLLANVQALRE